MPGEWDRKVTVREHMGPGVQVPPCPALRTACLCDRTPGTAAPRPDASPTVPIVPLPRPASTASISQSDPRLSTLPSLSSPTPGLEYGEEPRSIHEPFRRHDRGAFLLAPSRRVVTFPARTEAQTDLVRSTALVQFLVPLCDSGRLPTLNDYLYPPSTGRPPSGTSPK